MQNDIACGDVPGIVADHFEELVKMTFRWKKKNFQPNAFTPDHAVRAAKVPAVKFRTLDSEHFSIVLHIQLFDAIQSGMLKPIDNLVPDHDSSCRANAAASVTGCLQ